MWGKKVAIGLSFLLAVGTIIMAWQWQQDPCALAAKTVTVGKMSELKEQLAADETATIKLKSDITISEKLVVNGKKTLEGAGKILRRKTKLGEVFQEGLLKVCGSLVLKNVTVSGCGRNANVVDGAKERLIQVIGSSAKLVLDTGSALVQNYNANLGLDAGGAVLVGEGALVTMKTGSKIADNHSQTGGGAIRVCNKGKFIMEGGTIEHNVVTAASKNKELSGLGGAIHNRGTVEIKGGKICSNQASASRKEKNEDAGVGGAIYNLGSLKVMDGAIYSNNASCGAGAIYSTQSASVKISGGTIRDNVSENGPGGGLYINNGATATIEGGQVYGNRAFTGGGVYISKNSSKVTMKGGNIYGNTATEPYEVSGPGVRNNAATFIMEGGSINANQEKGIMENISTGHKDRYIGSALTNSGKGANALIRGGKIYSKNEKAKPVFNTSGALLQYGTKRTEGIMGAGETGVVNKGNMIVSGDNSCGLSGKFHNMIDNAGTLQVINGVIYGAKFGIRNQSLVKIEGGAVEGEEYGIYHKSGRLILTGRGIVTHVYLAKNRFIEQEGCLNLQNKMQITPEDYYDGRLVGTVSSGSDNGSTMHSQSKLTQKGNYYLYWKNKDVRIGKKSYLIEFNGNGGTGMMNPLRAYMDQHVKLPVNGFRREKYEFLGWSRKPNAGVEFQAGEKVHNLGDNGQKITLYAVWAKQPEIRLQKDSLDFYEGESVPASVLLSFVEAVDEKDGTISDKVRLINICYPGGRQEESPMFLNTMPESIGECQAVFGVTNSYGITSFATMKIHVLRNEVPVINCEERYFFMGEKSEQLLTHIQNGLLLSDQEDQVEDISSYLKIDVSGICIDKAGRYPVKVTIRDQRGHRFYMSPGEVREYGCGKAKTYTIFINLENKSVKKPDISEGHVRFISLDCLDRVPVQSKWSQLTLQTQLKNSFNQVVTDKACRQVWEFSSKDINQAKNYMISQINPFTIQCNRGFLQKFALNRTWNAKKGGENS